MINVPTPRDYQAKGIQLVREAIAAGHKKILFFLATGGGKSIIFLNICAGLHRNNKKICFVVRRKQLVLQARKHFLRAGIDSSIMLNTTKGFDSNKNFQICSIDTVSRRDTEFLRQYDYVIIDECHDTVSPTYKDFLSSFSDKTIFIGLTATPFPVGKRVHTFFDCVVKPIEVHELRDRKFLTDADIYIPTEIDLAEIKNGADGDFAKGELSKKMQDMSIVGDVVENYKKYGNNKPAICFCVDKNHSMLMSEMFKSHGIPAVHCDESTNQTDRDNAIEALRSGQIKVLCNVNIFSTGVDIPEAEIGLMARPTKSEILYIQQIGRLLRPYRKCGKCKSQYDNSDICPVCGYDRPSYIKEKATIIDFGNNASRHGLPFDVRFAYIKEDDKERFKKHKNLVKTCTNCFMVYDAHLPCCPHCSVSLTRERYYKTKAGDLVLFDEYETIKKSFSQLCRMELERRMKPNWKFFKLYDQYKESAMKYKQEFGIPSWIPAIYKKNMEEQHSGKVFS